MVVGCVELDVRVFFFGTEDGFLETEVALGRRRVVFFTGIHSFERGCVGLSSTEVVLVGNTHTGFFSVAIAVGLGTGAACTVVGGTPIFATSTYRLGPTKSRHDARGMGAV